MWFLPVGSRLIPQGRLPGGAGLVLLGHVGVGLDARPGKGERRAPVRVCSAVTLPSAGGALPRRVLAAVGNFRSPLTRGAGPACRDRPCCNSAYRNSTPPPQRPPPQPLPNPHPPRRTSTCCNSAYRNSTLPHQRPLQQHLPEQHPAATAPAPPPGCGRAAHRALLAGSRRSPRLDAARLGAMEVGRAGRGKVPT